MSFWQNSSDKMVDFCMVSSTQQIWKSWEVCFRCAFAILKTSRPLKVKMFFLTDIWFRVVKRSALEKWETIKKSPYESELWLRSNSWKCSKIAHFAQNLQFWNVSISTPCYWSAHRWSLNLVYTPTHHPPQELSNKDDICHASSYWTTLKTITSELITKEILVLVWTFFW